MLHYTITSTESEGFMKVIIIKEAHMLPIKLPHLASLLLRGAATELSREDY